MIDTGTNESAVNEISTEYNKYTKSNFLIGAKYKSSLLCNKLMAISLYNIQKMEFSEGENGIIYQRMKVSEIRKMLNVKGGSLYTQLEKAAVSMTGQTIGMSDPEKKIFDYIAVIIRAHCENGIFTIEYNPHISKYIKDIRSNFSTLSLPLMLSFNSNASFRLYELLKSKAYHHKGDLRTDNDVFIIKFSLSELKLNMGVINANSEKVKNVLSRSPNPDYDKAVEISPEKSFNNWADFKKRILEVAVKEINAQSDIEVEYETEKSGRGGKVTGITFRVAYKKDKNIKGTKEIEDIEPQKELTEIEKYQMIEKVSELFEEPIKFKDISTICENANYDFERIEKVYNVLKTNKTQVDSVVGFMIAGLRNDYSPAVVKEAGEKLTRNKKNSFNNFTQRTYDYDELEKILLNTEPN